MAYRAIEKLINLHDGYRKVVNVGDRQLLLLQENGVPRLIDRHCPHAGQVLDQAAIEGGHVTCPRHLMAFSLDDGRPASAECRHLKVYTLAYEGNGLGIDA